MMVNPLERDQVVVRRPRDGVLGEVELVESFVDREPCCGHPVATVGRVS